MEAATSSSIAAEESGKKNQHKLTRVVSTKLSIEDDDFLQYITTIAYKEGKIKEPSKSELVRIFVTLSLSVLRESYRLYSLKQLSLPEDLILATYAYL